MSSTMCPPSLAARTQRALRAASPATRTAMRSFALAARQHADVQRAFEPEEVPASFNLTETPSLAQADLETHQELRNMARLAAWEMPMLTSLSKPFEPPTEATPLRWRYTTYFGESHPAANKVVVEFGVSDIKQLDEAQRITLRKLAGPRRDPETDIIKMSCESFPSQAQNKRYLGEVITNLVKEAVNGKDKFEDIPVDDRHAVKKSRRRHRAYPVTQFPREWYLTPERRLYLDSKRGVQAQQLSGPVSNEQAAVAAVKRAAIEAGEMPEDAVLIEAGASSKPRPLVSGLRAIEVSQAQTATPSRPEPPRPAPVGRRFQR